jgi:DNA-binding protein H-NS
MAKLEQIQARIKKLQEQAEALVTKRAQGALDQIRELMLKHGLTTHDIEARAKAKRDRAQAARLGLDGKGKSAGARKGILPPKYRDPKTGATWSGHARPPAWIKNVKDRSKFLIDGGSAVAETLAAAGKTTARKAAAKKAGATSAAARKTGARKTAANTAAKKAGAKKTAAVKKTAAKRAAPAKKTAAKKTAAKKVGAKKVGVKKVAAKKTAAKKAVAKKAVRHVVVKHTGPSRKPSPSSSHVAGPSSVNGAITLS